MTQGLLPSGGPLAWAILALTLYGLIVLISGLVARLVDLVRPRGPVAFSVLVLIHNQQDSAEGLIRSLALRDWGRAGRWEIILVDLESTDDTPLILERLARQFPHIRLVQLPKALVGTACDAAMFLCRSNIALLIDLRHSVSTEETLRILRAIW